MADAGCNPHQWHRQQWHSLDLDAVARSNADLVRRAASLFGRGFSATLRGTVGKPVLAMIETAAGCSRRQQIGPETAGLIAGTTTFAPIFDFRSMRRAIQSRPPFR